ncbi:MAG: hypothetical protein Rubg2KO_12700 [Rubricoccaceae bacterium]
MAEPWTPAETERLIQQFKSVGREELLQLSPARSYSGIKVKALNLGLLSRPTESELRQRVDAGESLRHIGRAFDLDGKTIERYCRTYGIVLLSQPEATSRANRNDLPPTLFTSPLNPAASWVLGIIASDGNISAEERLRVVSTDLDIVQQCADITACGSVYNGSRGQHVWSYTATGLAKRLDTFGIHPAKSFTLGFPSLDTLDFPAFARGLWDGDGYWRIDKRGDLAGGFGCSSQAFIETFWDHLKPVAESRARVYKHPTKEHWVIRIDKRRAERLVRWLYPSPNVPACARKRAVVSPFLSTNCGGTSGCG